MSKILVFGHQNPDSDAIGSSVAFAYLAKEAYGLDTEAVALGTPNEETAFVLNYFGVEAPRVITSAKAEGAEQVILTDHNEFQQSVSDIAEVEVYGVVDHHRVANFETASPLYMRLEPVGSASSIVYRIIGSVTTLQHVHISLMIHNKSLQVQAYKSHHHCGQSKEARP